ncbi:MAG: alpha/beta hydrolase [Chloroflexi bacterium]|nr:alpha/beta hydrolase [Chloroflexota bacterium]
MTTSTGGLTLFDAARAMDVPFTKEVTPADKEVNARGFKFHYLDWGNESRPPLVLWHGRTNAAHTWDFTALACCQDYHILSLDMPGHGDSDWIPGGDYTVDSQVPILTGFINALGLGSFYLMGHSMGGRMAMVYTSQNLAKVRGLVMVDMAPQTGGRGEGAMAVGWRRLPWETDSFEEFVEAAHRVNPRRSPEQLRGSLALQLRQFPNGKWSWKWDPALREAETNGRTNEQHWEAASKITCPFLIIKGGESEMVPQETLDRLAFMHPKFRSVVVPGASHQVHGDKPALFIQAVQEFLRSVS